MEDLESELLADFGSDTDFSGPDEPTSTFGSSTEPLNNPENDPYDELVLVISHTSHKNLGSMLEQYDINSSHIDVKSISRVYKLIPYIQDQIKKYSSSFETDFDTLLASVSHGVVSGDTSFSEYSFIVMMNELLQVINDETAQLHTFIKLRYKVVFPELELLVLNPIDYVSAVLTIQQNLEGVASMAEDLKKILSNDQVLVVTMSALQEVKRSRQRFILNEDDFSVIQLACAVVLSLHQIHKEISNYVEGKLCQFAPNLVAIVGKTTASQLLASSGSLKLLGSMPACNVPALGKRDMSSMASVMASLQNVRQTGYIFHSDVVKYLPVLVMKQAIRITSGKVVLAARIDLARSNPDGDIGAKLSAEIKSKIDKLLTPPDSVAERALPAPIEQKSKKRAGRRFRKVKERFQLSELRKAQNKMQFGQAEETMVDSFGEEIGLGMSRSSGKLAIGGGGSSSSSKVSKKMAERLKDSSNQSQGGDAIDSFVVELDGPEEEKKKKWNEENGGNRESKWFGGMKRKREEEE